jgi:hypothetical protein
MDWREINCLIEALEALIEKQHRLLADASLDDDSRSDLSNDLGYSELLLSSYQQKREDLRR